MATKSFDLPLRLSQLASLREQFRLQGFTPEPAEGQRLSFDYDDLVRLRDACRAAGELAMRKADAGEDDES